jgi:pimeloyl-ACP methyl ester carboxylesterase
MKYITSTAGSSQEEVQLHYVDYGNGIPVVLIHGWPLNMHMWEYQVNDLVNAGFRVIKYDRRGFGKSDKPWDGYDYDTFADDLQTLLTTLDLQNAVLVGFSMGGGEVVRYISRHGSDRVSKIVLISAVTPFLQKTGDNPDGVPGQIFNDMIAELKEDRNHFLEEFGKKFFGVNVVSKPVSKAMLEYYCIMASSASPKATEECVKAFAGTDFRPDLENINVPTLIIHGGADKTVPAEASSDRAAKMISDCDYKVYDGAPHGLFYTEKETLNRDLINFIQEGGLLPGAMKSSRKVSSGL